MTDGPTQEYDEPDEPTRTDDEANESTGAGDEPAESNERAPVVEVEGLSHAFGDVDVFSDLSFSLEAGSVTALVGPNGSGKTTLLRAVLGLLEPDEGRVTLTGVGPTDRRVGYLPQRPQFRPTFTVAETLQFYADLLDREVDVPGIVDRVGLSGASDRRVDALSGGMTRLLGIGQAVLGDPPLVVLDEPTGDLDPRMTEYIFELVGELADDGMAVLLATHNLAGAEAADSVLLLDHGDVVAEGSPADFVARTDAEDFRGAFLALTGGDAAEAGVDADRATPTVSVRTRGGDGE
ncbi:ABC transporter ATP-binding protein [Halorussus litoreus]|uniref:ABC transporter ATP-binding protein n=1 Tax=Halorussus litoreus TaxID=1710536 RepID=UPI000E23541B|nr:ABC transporter ATP-binding protein [Halorussus litoreus]